MVKWRVGLGWYAVAFLLPSAISGAAAGLNVLLGAEPHAAASFADWPSFVLTFLLVLLVPGYGGPWEEPGWRGYAQPRLQSQRTALAASLIVGVVLAGWHLPLFATGQASRAELGSMIGAAVVFAWVFNSTGGSVLLVMLLHATNNTFSGELFGRMFTGADVTTQAWLLSGLWCLVALAVIVVAGAARLSHRTRVPVIGDVDLEVEPAVIGGEARRPQPVAAPAASV
jgi:membrane protease YdiL (CAAX protease family)